MKRAGSSAVVVFLVGTTPAWAGAPQPSSVERTTTIPAGETRSLTLACPRRTVALNGAVGEVESGVTAIDSLPRRDARRWTFRLAARAGAGERRAAASLRCIRLRLPRRVRRLRLLTATQRRPDLTVPARSTRRVVVDCPRGFLPTGWGLERGSQGTLQIAAAVPASGRWVFRLENAGPGSTTGTVHVRCVQRSQRGQRAGRSRTVRHAFRFRRAGFRDRVGMGGAVGLSRSCRRSEFSVATGAGLDHRDDLVMIGSHPSSARDGDWSFAHRNGRPEPVRLYLLCLALESRFR